MGQLSTLLKSLPDDEKGQNYRRRIIARGGDTGIWLSTIQNLVNDNNLGAQEFYNAFRQRFGLPLNNLPDLCDGCGANFSLEHAQSCKFGGLIHSRHDDFSYEIKTLAALALRDSA